MAHRFRVWAPAVAMMAAIFYASSIPDLAEIPGGLSDKTAHFAAYAALGALMLRALSGSRAAMSTTRAALLAIVISSAYGATDEAHQHFVHGRSPDVNDWVADTLGAAVAVLLCWVIATLIQRRRLQRGEV